MDLTNSRQTSALLSAFLALTSGCVAATPPASPASPAVIPLDHLPALKGDYFPIHSAATGGGYHIYIRLPEGYGDKPRERFPVIYVLDGDSLFPLLAPHHLFLTYDDKLPEAILVGIAYGSFAPPTNRRDADFGLGSAAFQRFLKEELIPQVEQRTRADPRRRILLGQSRGGGFVLYSAFTEPDLFWGRIASNPSYLAHRALVLGPAPAHGSGDVRLAVVSGTRDRPQLRQDALTWFGAREQQPGPWAMKRIDIEGGTHAADVPNAYRAAMRWLFSNAPSSQSEAGGGSN